MSRETQQMQDQLNLIHHLADEWNAGQNAPAPKPTKNPAVINPLPQLCALSQLPATSLLNERVNKMYLVLDEFDSPIKEDERHILPVSNGLTTNALSMNENIRVNYLKRALSFFHGAMLAIQYEVTLDDVQKLEALNRLIKAYNLYKDGPPREEFDDVEEEDFWGKDQAIFLKKMLVRMSLILEDYGLGYKDLCAGEMIANMERVRARRYISEYENTKMTTGGHTLNCKATLSETPISAQMDSKHFDDLFSFISEFENNSIYYREAPEWFRELDIEGQNKLIDAYLNKGVNQYNCYQVKHLYIELKLPIPQITHPQSLIFLNKLGFLLKVPAWFRELRPSVQEYLIRQENNEERKKLLPSIPATLRSIPLLANMNIHQGEFKRGDTFTINHTVYRHGVFTPYGIVNHAERKAACQANGKAFADILLPKAKEKYKNFWAPGVMMNGDEFLPGRNIPIADISLLSPNDFKGIEENLQKRRLEKKLHAAATTHDHHEKDDDSEKSDDEGTASDTLAYQKRLSGKINQESNRSLRDENMDAYRIGVSQNLDGKNFENLSTNLGINGDRWIISDTFENKAYKATQKRAIERFAEVENLIVKSVPGNQKRVELIDSTKFSNASNFRKFLMARDARDQLCAMQRRFDKPFKTSTELEKSLSERINAELFANCLYAIMIEGMGGTVSACCKSTKDRTGLFVLHLDAMHQFYTEYGRLPHYDDAEPMITHKEGETLGYDKTRRVSARERFVEIMADLYLGNMQQYMASQATFGSAGIKKPGGTVPGYSLAPIPTDLMETLQTKSPGLFERQKELADINKIGFKMGFINFVKSPSKTIENTTIWYCEKIAYYKELFIEKLNKLWDYFFEDPKTGVEQTVRSIRGPVHHTKPADPADNFALTFVKDDVDGQNKVAFTGA